MRESDISTTRGEVSDSYRETKFHISRGEWLYHISTVSIAGEEWEVSNVLELERLRRENAPEFRCLMECVGNPPRRKILAALVQNSPRTYADLSEWTTVTERTVKTHVHTLRDESILTVEEGRPASISFLSSELRLLASDVLSFSP